MSEHAKVFQAIIDKARSLDHPMRVAVAGADAENILIGLFEAESEGWVKPVLVGNYEKIRTVLEKIGCQDRKYDIQPVADGTSPVSSRSSRRAPSSAVSSIFRNPPGKAHCPL